MQRLYRFVSLTESDIRRHIVGYKGRIEVAKLNLANLPEGRLPLKEHKKREQQLREYRAEIRHCKQLIVYANEGIQLRKQGAL
jgi:hypothetical protein